MNVTTPQIPEAVKEEAQQIVDKYNEAMGRARSREWHRKLWVKQGDELVALARRSGIPAQALIDWADEA